MRIISKFKDYYDFTCAYGYDEDRVYIRKTQCHFISKSESLSRCEKTYIQVIGFCGKIYPFINMLGNDLLTFKCSNNLRHNIIIHKDIKKYRLGGTLPYDVDSTEEDILRAIPQYLEQSTKSKPWFHRYYSTDSIDIIRTGHYAPLFEQFKTPIFYAVSQETIYTNPPLDKLLFHQVIPGAIAFQEIEMYLANVINKVEVDEIKRTDKQILQQKGFDKKISFRTRKKT